MTYNTNPGPYAVVLAGGSGTRFWPKSRKLKPKQLCKLGGSEMTMIEQAIARIEGKIPPSRRIVVTNVDLLQSTKELLGASVGHYIAEPFARNTAAALCLAALHIEHLEDGRPAVMVSLHADHLISNIESFQRTIDRAIAVATKGFLTLIGLSPDTPSTSFGYIEVGEALNDTESYEVKSFKEKPDFALAASYVKSGKFLWNSGIFVWDIVVFLEQLAAHEPEIVRQLRDARDMSPNCSVTSIDSALLKSVFTDIKSIAIDHALLERSNQVAVVKGEFDWQDVGSWDALDRCFPTDEQGNYQDGDTMLLHCSNTTVDTDGPLVAAIGVKDLVIVCNGNAILVCPKDRCQEVKLIVEKLNHLGRKDFV